MNSKVDPNCHNRKQEYRPNLQGDKVNGIVLDANSMDYNHIFSQYLYFIWNNTCLTEYVNIQEKYVLYVFFYPLRQFLHINIVLFLNELKFGYPECNHSSISNHCTL